MPLTEKDMKQVKGISELTVREYFDHFREQVLPAMMATMIMKHEASCQVGKKVNKWFYLISGGVAVLALVLGPGAVKTLVQVIQQAGT